MISTASKWSIWPPFLNTVYCIFIPSVAKFLFSNCAPYPCCCFSRVLMSLCTRSWWTPRVSFPHLKIRHKQKPMKRSFCRRSGSFLPTIQRSGKKALKYELLLCFCCSWKFEIKRFSFDSSVPTFNLISLSPLLCRVVQSDVWSWRSRAFPPSNLCHVGGETYLCLCDLCNKHFKFLF